MFFQIFIHAGIKLVSAFVMYIHIFWKQGYVTNYQIISCTLINNFRINIVCIDNAKKFYIIFQSQIIMYNKFIEIIMYNKFIDFYN